MIMRELIRASHVNLDEELIWGVHVLKQPVGGPKIGGRVEHKKQHGLHIHVF